MPEASEFAFPFVVRTVKGAEVKFGKLSPRDRQGVLDKLKVALRQSRKADAVEAGLPAEQVYAELRGVSEMKLDEQKFIGHVNTPGGKEDVVRVGFAKCNGDADPTSTIDAVEMADGGLLSLVCDLCNLKPVTDETAEDGEKKEGEGNPTKPATPATTQGYGS